MTWMSWLEMEWNRPSRIDHYLMQIAKEVKRLFKKNPEKIQHEEFQLKFEVQAAKPQMTREQRIAASKAAWFGWLGIKQSKE